MSDLPGFGRWVSQRGDERGGDAPGGGRGDIPRGRGSRLAADEFTGRAGPGLKSSIIERKIEEMRVLSAYSNEVISNNLHAFRIKSRRLIAWIYEKTISATIYARTAAESGAQGLREVVERELVNLQ